MPFSTFWGYCCCRTGSGRLEGLLLDPEVLRQHSIRVVAPDRPGYGESTPHPARNLTTFVGARTCLCAVWQQPGHTSLLVCSPLPPLHSLAAAVAQLLLPALLSQSKIRRCSLQSREVPLQQQQDLPALLVGLGQSPCRSAHGGAGVPDPPSRLLR